VLILATAVGVPRHRSLVCQKRGEIGRNRKTRGAIRRKGALGRSKFKEERRNQKRRRNRKKCGMGSNPKK
jgi:hypothetical protein